MEFNKDKDKDKCGKTICLNMIVKNESHIIVDTLKNLCSYINFSYWVISDTGSTDNTKELITDFFKEKGIPGEIVEHEWVDFAYNRTKALESAFNKTDFIFIFDADDSIVDDFKLPEVYDCDKYLLKFGKDFVYVRPLLFTNRKRWRFKGVLHEYLENIDPVNGSQNIEGNYHVISGRSGNRSKNPNKYIDDANILKAAHFKEVTNDYGLSCRYAFYCAQSYKDSGDKYVDDAIEWYKKCLDFNMWNQEKFHSCFSIGEMYIRKKDYANALKYWCKSIEYDSERVEGIVNAVSYLRNDGQHLLVNALYNKFKNYKKVLENKLFLFQSMYNDQLEYENSISAYYVNDKESGYECCKRILVNNILDYNLIKSTMANFKFYIHLLKTDTNENALKIFNAMDNLLCNISLKNDTIDDNMRELWNTLFERVKPMLIDSSGISQFKQIQIKKNNSNNKISNSNNKVTIMITFTTCKRFDLFKQTINSILNNWTDINKIDYWFCVDDNSSASDRKDMSRMYPWIKYYMKPIEEKGHLKSMNIIWNKLNELKPTYWIHMEDDFLFHHKTNYIEQSIAVLNGDFTHNIKQVLFNVNYGETIDNYNVRGHITLKSTNNIALHNYCKGDFNYPNCHYWPYYSFRPSLIETKVILELGNFDSVNKFFEMDYALKWLNSGYKSAFFNRITCRHIGRLTSDKNTKNVKNAYELNNESQFFENENQKNENDKKIKIINLERRKDRKEATIKILSDAQIDPSIYAFVNAVDGQSLEPTSFIKELFDGNDFGNRKGVIGCALSHYNIWKQLVDDKTNDYYIIMEDDFTICPDFKEKLEQLMQSDELVKRDVVFLGYHMFEKERQENLNIYNIFNDELEKIVPLNKHLYIGGTFMYSINKNGAKQMLDYIKTNNIKHGIDYVMKINNILQCFECQPQLVFSEWNENSKQIDSDIQNIYDCLDFTNIVTDPVINQNNIYINGVSGLGNNLFQIALAIYYKETYKNMNFNIILDKSSKTLIYGTANEFGRQKLKTSYLENILNKFQTINKIPTGLNVLNNDFSSLNAIDFTNTTNTTNLVLSGFSQNVDLFFDVRDKLLNYLNLDDESIKQPLLKKYKFDNSAINIMLGIRIGNDGGYRYSKFTKQSYAQAINSIIELNIDKVINIYVISDVDEFSCMIDNSDKYNIIYVDEDDISQIYVGLMCNHFILSDSTYHWWIAFLKWSQDNSVSVYAFNNTFITNGCFINSILKKAWTFLNIIPDDSFVFFKNLDHIGDDICCKRGSVPILIEHAKNVTDCVAFNTLGFFKHKVDLNTLQVSQYFDTNDGLYVKKEYCDKYKSIKIKMLCNWTSSEQLCKDWSNMCEKEFKWKNYELVWTDVKEDIDYYIIINSVSNDVYFDPKRTIVFQMEPWVYDLSKPWGVKTWDKWAEPNPTHLLAVRGRKSNCHNNAFWQLELTLNDLQKPEMFEKNKGSIVSSICSSKYFDEGHIARIDFLKFLEAKGDVDLDIWNQDNKHNFKNYRGPVNEYINKSNGLKGYKYYFMIENNYESNFITEKLWEPILCETLVFYYGCPNVTHYIDPAAFVLLDINDFEKSYQLIKQAISEDWWSQRIEIIRKEKRKILDELAFFPTIDKIIKPNRDFSNNNPKKYCFIHSCHLKEVGINILNEIISNLINSNSIQYFEKIFIVNIGEKLDANDFTCNKIEIINYSDNTDLYEIPTINLIHTFCENNDDCEILYLHTKGITHPYYKQIVDWRNMMLYFLVNKCTDCFELLKTYDTIGCNRMTTTANHYSGNFWWANSNYIKSLNKISDSANKYDAEFWLFSNKSIKSYEIHNSNVNHYHYEYPVEKYAVM